MPCQHRLGTPDTPIKISFACLFVDKAQLEPAGAHVGMLQIHSVSIIPNICFLNNLNFWFLKLRELGYLMLGARVEEFLRQIGYNF